jgi:hypothetical protein
MVAAACNGAILQQEEMGDEGFRSYPSYSVLEETAAALEPEVEDVEPVVEAAREILDSL